MSSVKELRRSIRQRRRRWQHPLKGQLASRNKGLFGGFHDSSKGRGKTTPRKGRAHTRGGT